MSAIRSVFDPEVRDIVARTPPSNKFHASPNAWEDQVLYFLLPDRFSDAHERIGSDNDSSLTPLYQPSDAGNAIRSEEDAAEWREAGVRFVKGTLKGLRSKLDYLKRLGVTAIWVGPIFKQVAELETYHGYGVQDFLDIDPRFGTREELQDIVAAAHERGIYVILDIILNHSGNVFEYVAQDPHYTGEVFPVKGFYNKAEGLDANGNPNKERKPDIPFAKVNEKDYPDAFPGAAVWPSELQDSNCFTRKGRINDNGWDSSPEFLDGDFFDLKDIALGEASPENFRAPPSLKTLCEVYKYWIAFADIDGYRIDTVKHMGDGPTRYFASVIHEFAQNLGKNKFLLIGEITGNRAFETVEATGIDAALGLGNVQANLWQVPKGRTNPTDYFNLFRNALYLNKGSHTWFRDKVVTMLDDHDQVWRGNSKGRFCSEGNGDKLLVAAIALNLLTLGIPCIYYGTEQAFDGEGGSDRYIREAMFGGDFGAFRSKDRHFFDESSDRWKDIAKLAQLRTSELALSRGRQYLRDISGDGVQFGPPAKVGDGPMRSVVAWSRLFAERELLCAINTDVDNTLTVWVTVDEDVHPEKSSFNLLFGSSGASVPATLQVERRSSRCVVNLTVPAAGVVVYK